MTMKRDRRMFSPGDDDELAHLIAMFGEGNWAEVALRMTVPFTSRQCRERWRNYLSPELDHGHWTEEEDRRLLSEFQRYGTRWTLIAITFPGRSGNALRNRYFLLQRRKQKRWKGEEDPAAATPAVTFPGPADLMASVGTEVAPLLPPLRFPDLPGPPPTPAHETPRSGPLAFPSLSPAAELPWLGTDQLEDLRQEEFLPLLPITKCHKQAF
jgi:hypothetical protein